jgi:radical SAM superfamily enzyme YgiQ (UPF0313 family)
MELPRRTHGDELIRPGELNDLRHRLRRLAPKHDLVSVIAYAFDHRTRMLPFIFADTRMAPAGVRAIGSAFVDVGFEKTRIVLQQWNRNFRPSQMQLDGRFPDLFMVSSMSLHSEQCMDLVRDACKIDRAHRPLIIAGGPHAVYMPYDFFSPSEANPASADVVITGEEFVLLSFLEVILSARAPRESLRNAFFRVRDSGELKDIPGLVYARGDGDHVAEELIDSGVQRLVGDLDELPHPTLGFRLLEPPSRRPTLGAKPLPDGQIGKLSPIGSLVMTFGCKFSCAYCPIPAYNQRQHRVKSGARIAEEMMRLNDEFGIRYFFGADDNFFNNKARTLEIVETLAGAQINGVSLNDRRIHWATEVTVHDTLQMKEYLPLVHRAGCRALWLGVEDMTATLVKKGQSVSKTTEVFGRLRDAGICPMPMMMHHDSQPLFSHGSDYGLLNQVRILRKAGAVTLQVLMMTPAMGTKLFEPGFVEGQVFDRVGGKPVTPHMYDGNYVVASTLKRPHVKQFNMLIAYLYFYNPVWPFVRLLNKTPVSERAAFHQLVGMAGLAHTIGRTFGWAMRLMFGKIKRHVRPPSNPIRMRSVDGTAAAHDGCSTHEQATSPEVLLHVLARPAAHP